MRIALDFDGTYTLDPSFWDSVILLAESAGHEIVCVTARPEHYSDDDLEVLPDSVKVYKTRMVPKREFMVRLASEEPDVAVWIDDIPEMICGCGLRFVQHP
ncbi:MAG: hypothetical protein ABFS14_09920 [Gemmatimonadota bacterium]